MHEFSPSGGVLKPVIEVRNFKPNIYQDKYGQMCEVLDILRLPIIIVVLVITIYKIFKSHKKNEEKANQYGINTTGIFGILITPNIFLNIWYIGIFLTCFSIKFLYLNNNVREYFQYEMTGDWVETKNIV